MKKERLEERFGIKVLITILCLTVVQLGNIIPIPTINTAYFSYLVSKTSVLGMMNRFSGGAFQNMTLCALGISIYISASIVIPIIIELSINLGISTLAIAFPAALASSLAFILITSTPTNVIAYSAGYFSIKDFAKAGVLMSIVSCVIVAVVMYGVGLLTGLY